MSTHQQPDDTIKTPPDHPRHEDERLDEAIQESFPASDPVSISIDEPPADDPQIEDPPPADVPDDGSDPVRRAAPGSATR